MSDPLAVLEARVREARNGVKLAGVLSVEIDIAANTSTLSATILGIDAVAAAAEALGRARAETENIERDTANLTRILADERRRTIAECMKAVTACYPSTPKWPRAAFDVLDDALAALAALEKTT